jgi:Uma2 family endonuclease
MEGEKVMTNFVYAKLGGEVRIPAWVVDLESFCRWATSEDYPESGWFSYLKGELWVDLSMERVGHNQIKGRFAIVVGSLVDAAESGRYFHDRMGLSNVEADLGTEPDGMYASDASFRAERVRLVAGEGEDALLLEGTPDMVLEVVSPTSEVKDKEVLRELYWLAGIPEYWLVDPLGDQLQFDILRHTPKGYVATRRQGGWIKSAVFGKAFRLTEKTRKGGHTQYVLEVR